MNVPTNSTSSGRYVELRSDGDVQRYAEQLSHTLHTMTASQRIDQRRLLVSTPQTLLSTTVNDRAEPDQHGSALVYDDELAETVGPFWSAAKVAAEFGGITRQALKQRRDRGTLLGVKSADGEIFYPISQFRRSGGHIQVKPGQLEILKALKGADAWSVAVLMHTPAPELDNATPLEWEARGGEPGASLALAQKVRQEWNRR